MTATAVKSAARTARHEKEPLMLEKRIGSTTYVVAVHFNQSEKETMSDKVLRLIESEVRHCA